MAGRGPKPVTVSPTVAQERRLRQWADGRRGPVIARRAAIVLACSEGAPNSVVADRLGLSVPTVRKWRGRFARAGVDGLFDGSAPAAETEPGAPAGPVDGDVGERVPTYLWEQIAAALRDQILAGGLAPGERLAEAELADRFAASRGPVREAIRELARQGLVVEQARRTAVVCSPTERDLFEVYAVRGSLELLAAESLIERLPPGALATLEGHLEALEECWRRGDGFIVAARHDLAFHRSLLALAGNRRAIEMNERMLSQTALLLRSAAEANPRLRTRMARRVHRDIVAALRAGDRQAVRGALDRHHDHAVERLLGSDLC